MLRGRPDELVADVAERVALVEDPGRRHPMANGRALRTVRDRAHDLARRVGAGTGPVDHDALGRVLALAYPDRLGQVRPGRRSRFRLWTGSMAWVADSDPLVGEDYIVVADLDGKRKESRIRLAAGLNADDALAAVADDAVETSVLQWDSERDDLIVRVQRRVDGLELGTVFGRPEPGEPNTVDALLDRCRSTSLGVLKWTEAARSTQARIGFLRRTFGEMWPACDDDDLLAGLDDLAAALVDPSLGARRPPADRSRRCAPVAAGISTSTASWPGSPRHRCRSRPAARFRSTTPRTRPSLSVRVQEMFGTTTTPSVAGGAVPLRLHLLSPAGRPVQITSDLAGFWAGSWSDVRKDLAGRYPKHSWPTDPASAHPERK